MGRTARKRRLKNQEIFNNLPKNNEDLYEKLRSWMLINNWKAACNLEPYVFKTTGRGLMTLDKVDANQVVLKVPKSLLITTAVVSQSSVGKLFSADTSYSAQCVIAIFLIYEKHLGELSYWKPYLDTLPNTYTNPEFCTKTEKKLLPTFISNELDIISKRLKSSYVSLIKSIRKLHNDSCDHCHQSLYDIFTYHKFVWAYYTVNTRAIYMNNEKEKCFPIRIKEDDNLAMAPLLDLFNHTCETVADAQLTRDSSGQEYYYIKALRSCDPKMQVFINYGAHSSLKLYLEYGFFIPGNPLDQIVFNLSDVKKCHQVSESASSFLRSNGFDKNMAFTLEGLNYNAKNALFIVTSNPSEETFWKDKIYREEFDSKDLKPLNDLGLILLQNLKTEHLALLNNMKNIVNRSESYSMAIGIIEEYLEIIEKSFKYLKMFSSE